MVFEVGHLVERETRRYDYEALEAADETYDAVPAWNFSRDFLARIPGRLIALRVAGVGWSDWGTRDAIARTLASLKVPAPWRLRAGAAA